MCGKDKIWLPRKKDTVIGGIVTTNPTEGERYYLRILLNHIKGACSFHDFKTVNGTLVSSFREAALLHGLLKGDNYLNLCLEEASLYQMPYTLCRLFTILLAYCVPDNPKFLWENFETVMSADYMQLNACSFNTRKKVLQHLSY